MASADLTPKKRRAEGRREAGERTRARIMNVAERLFAEQGVEGTSLRQIMTTAGVSISLINYHFGTKEHLLTEIFERRAIPMNVKRMAMLESLSEDGQDVTLDALLRIFVVPPLEAILVGDSENFIRLLGRISADPSPAARKIVSDYFDNFHYAFLRALKTLKPELDDTNLFWRLHCLLAVVMYTVTNPERTYDLSGGLCNPRDMDSAVEGMMPLLTAMIDASATR